MDGWLREYQQVPASKIIIRDNNLRLLACKRASDSSPPIYVDRAPLRPATRRAPSRWRDRRCSPADLSRSIALHPQDRLRCQGSSSTASKRAASDLPIASNRAATVVAPPTTLLVKSEDLSSSSLACPEPGVLLGQRAEGTTLSAHALDRKAPRSVGSETLAGRHESRSINDPFDTLQPRSRPQSFAWECIGEFDDAQSSTGTLELRSKRRIPGIHSDCFNSHKLSIGVAANRLPYLIRGGIW